MRRKQQTSQPSSSPQRLPNAWGPRPLAVLAADLENLPVNRWHQQTGVSFKHPH